MSRQVICQGPGTSEGEAERKRSLLYKSLLLIRYWATHTLLWDDFLSPGTRVIRRSTVQRPWELWYSACSSPELGDNYVHDGTRLKWVDSESRLGPYDPTVSFYRDLLLSVCWTRWIFTTFLILHPPIVLLRLDSASDISDLMHHSYCLCYS